MRESEAHKTGCVMADNHRKKYFSRPIVCDMTGETKGEASAGEGRCGGERRCGAGGPLFGF